MEKQDKELLSIGAQFIAAAVQAALPKQDDSAEAKQEIALNSQYTCGLIEGALLYAPDEAVQLLKEFVKETAQNSLPEFRMAAQMLTAVIINSAPQHSNVFVEIAQMGVNDISPVIARVSQRNVAQHMMNITNNPQPSTPNTGQSSNDKPKGNQPS